MNVDLRRYLEKLDQDFSFYLPYNKGKNNLLANNNINFIE